MKSRNSRFLFLLFLLAVMSNLVHAQIRVGFKAGLNSNSFRPADKTRFFLSRDKVESNIHNSQPLVFNVTTGSGSSTVTTSTTIPSPVDQHYHISDISVLGFNAGAYAKYQILGFLTARAELLYFQQGGTIENYYILYPTVQHKNVKLNQHIIQIPVIAELGVPGMEENAVQPKLRLGGYYGFTLASTERFDEVSKSAVEKTTIRTSANVSGEYVYSQAGFLVGVGADIKMGDKDFSLEFRYNQNLTIINESDAALSHLNSTLKNYQGNLRTSTFSFNVGMTLFNF